MTAQKGRDMLLKVDDGSGSFVTVAGLRAHRLSLSAAQVDATHQLSPGQWRELLAGAGLRQASISASGIFVDEASDARIRQLFFDAVHARFQVIVPDFGIIEGPFQIAALEYTGSHDGELAFEIALESAGELTFTAL